MSGIGGPAAASGVQVWGGGHEKIHMGQNICCVPQTLVAVVPSGEIWIEDYVVLGYGVKFLCGYHDYTKRDAGRYNAPSSGYDIRIGRGVWIASYAIICGPVTIGQHAVVGAGAVVTHDIPEEELWAGNPARFVKKIQFTP